MQTGNVFQIQRFTIHDGPGLRTELFLKGCPLRCAWCSNPESQMPYQQAGVYRSKCISRAACGMCEDVCPAAGALRFSRGKLRAIDRDICTNCLECADECPADAIKQWGITMSVAECMREIRRDVGYFQKSGGGVTVSGGEPLMQAAFVTELFAQCKKEQIHTCLESTLYADWDSIEQVLAYTDLVIADIKQMDTQLHRKHTGVGNERILENLKKLAACEQELIVRIPVIPHVNDDEENCAATADFILKELHGRVKTLQLLSFMRLGVEKYESLGMPYPMKGMRLNRPAFQKRVEGLADYFEHRGIHCTVGTKERQ